MLVLSRTRGEKIRLGDDVTIVVVEIHANKVSIGIEAPKSVRVFREELLAAEALTKEDEELAAKCPQR